MDHDTKGHAFKYASLKNNVNLHLILAFTPFVTLAHIHFSHVHPYW